MNKRKELREYYKRNPISHYEDMLGFKFTKFQKVKFKMYSCLVDCMNDLIFEKKNLLEEIIIEPYGTTRYEALKLHSVVLELKIDIIKGILKIQ